MRFVIAVVFGFQVMCGFSQDWDKRHAFAKMYIGISNNIIPTISDGTYLNSNGDTQSFSRAGFLSPAVNIGATHFWGYADLFVSISTADIFFGDDAIDFGYRLGTFTGFKIYPFPSKEHSIRPYLGYKFSPFRYKQYDLNGEAFKYTDVKSVIDAGLGWQLPNFYLTLEYGRVMNPSFTTYISPTQTAEDAFPANIIEFGFNYTIETTKLASTPANKRANDYFSQSNKHGLFVAAGPSSAFPLASSSYIKTYFPYLDDYAFPSIFPDIAAGYHFTKLDLIADLAFRPMVQRRSAYGVEQTLRRTSLNLESYKFLFDYHGFVPYLGLGLGYEAIRFTESENSIKSQQNDHQISPNLVFGWDIRPSEKGDWWVLRTNLRYYPFLQVEKDGETLSLQHLEFNFIQLVVYPQRLKQVKRLAQL